MRHGPKNLKRIAQMAGFSLFFFMAALASPCAAAESDATLPDPEFDGKKLSVWLTEASFGIERMHVIPPSAGQKPWEARAAIKKEGTNLIPALLAWMRVHQTGNPTLDWQLNRQRAQAASALSLLASAAKQSIPQLIEMLDDPDGGQIAAARLLSQFGADAKQAIPKLIELLKQPTDKRVDLVYIIGAFRSEATEAIPTLIELFKEPQSLRQAAASALSYIGTPAVEPVARALTNSDERLHLGAATSLNWMIIGGLTPTSAVPALIIALNDHEPEVRLASAMTLSRIRSPDSDQALLATLPALERLAHEQNENISNSAKIWIGELKARQWNTASQKLQAIKIADEKLDGTPKKIVEQLNRLSKKYDLPTHQGVDIRFDPAVNSEPSGLSIFRVKWRMKREMLQETGHFRNCFLSPVLLLRDG